MKLTACFISILLCLQLHAQINEKDSLNQRIDSLESLIREKNYSRIPIGDLDKSLEVRVQSEVYNAFYKYLAVLGLFLFGGGFGLYRSLQGELKNQVEATVKENHENYLKQLKEMTEVQNRENGRQDILIKSLTDNIESLTKKQETFFSEVSLNIEKKISEATRIIWNDIAENKLRTAKESKYMGATLAREINNFIDNESVKIGDDKKQRLVDTLMRTLYNTPESELKQQGYGNKYQEMIKLLKKHENNIDLLPETYVNAAIALNNNYEYYRNAEDKKLCLDCCDKALLKLKDYGIPFILKLEVLTMDYKNAYDQKEKDESLDQLRRLFHVINSNQSGALFFEAVERLQVDKRVPYLKPYLELLEQICNDELKLVKEKAMKFFVSRDVLNVDVYKDLFFNILKEEMKLNVNYEGKWMATKSVVAGIEDDLKTIPIEFTIDRSVFSIKEGSSVTSGYVHFLNYNQKGLFNLYFFDADNKYIQTAYCKSEIKADNSLIICANYSSENRPDEYNSTAENKFYLQEFVKA